jgi:hypothetical protein
VVISTHNGMHFLWSTEGEQHGLQGHP